MHAAISSYALGGGRLARIFATHQLPWDAAQGQAIVDTAAKTIAGSVASRGETSYSLGESNSKRVASVQKYLEKLVAIRVAKK